MSITHEAQCDGCGKRAAAEEHRQVTNMLTGQPYSGGVDYKHPSDWINVGHYHVCSWECCVPLAQRLGYAARGTEAVTAKPSERKARSRSDAPKAKSGGIPEKKASAA